MAQLKTTFAGLTLNNPIIISSSGLTNSLAKIQKLEEAGAGAVVLKSVFEEQINMQAGSMQGALNEHITLIEDVKKHCKIPVIASINCYSDSEWTDFARLMEEAGAGISFLCRPARIIHREALNSVTSTSCATSRK